MQRLIGKDMARCNPPPQESTAGPLQDLGMILLGLKPTTTETSIREYFKDKASIHSILLKTKKGPTNFAFIRFNDKSVQLSLQGPHHIDGKECILQTAYNKTKEEVSKHKVFVGFHDDTITMEELKEHFEQFGKVENVFIPSPWRPFAFVTFRSAEVAQQLVGERHYLRNIPLTLRRNINHQQPTNDPSPSPSPPPKSKQANRASELWTTISTIGKTGHNQEALEVQQALFEESHLRHLGFPNPFKTKDSDYLRCISKYDINHHLEEPERSSEAHLLALILTRQEENRTKLATLEATLEANSELTATATFKEMEDRIKEMEDRIEKLETEIAYLPREYTANPTTGQVKSIVMRYAAYTVSMGRVVRRVLTNLNEITNAAMPGNTTKREEIEKLCSRLKRMIQNQQQDIESTAPSEVD